MSMTTLTGRDDEEPEDRWPPELEQESAGGGAEPEPEARGAVTAAARHGYLRGPGLDVGCILGGDGQDGHVGPVEGRSVLVTRHIFLRLHRLPRAGGKSMEPASGRDRPVEAMNMNSYSPIP